MSRAFWLHTGVDLAIDRAGQAHRETMLLWYRLMADLYETRGKREFTTTLAHWCRRYGGHVPTDPAEREGSWKPLMLLLWGAYAHAGVVTIEGDLSAETPVRVTFHGSSVGEPEAAVELIAPVTGLGRGGRPRSAAALDKAVSRHRERITRGRAACSDIRECVACRGKDIRTSVDVSDVFDVPGRPGTSETSQTSRTSRTSEDVRSFPPSSVSPAPAPSPPGPPSPSPPYPSNSNPPSSAARTPARTHEAEPTTTNGPSPRTDELPTDHTPDEAARAEIRKLTGRMGSAGTEAMAAAAAWRRWNPGKSPLAELRDVWRPMDILRIERGGDTHFRAALGAMAESKTPIGNPKSWLRTTAESKARDAATAELLADHDTTKQPGPSPHSVLEQAKARQWDTPGVAS